MSNPGRKVLVAVSGMSPQIITETLYGLIRPQDGEAPWLPDEIHLITTEDGREQARLQLLEGQGYFQQFLRDYEITQPVRFTGDSAGCGFASQRQAVSKSARDRIIRRLSKSQTQTLRCGVGH